MVAAGSGTRLGAGVPKALVELAGEPLVVHAVRQARLADGVEHVVVVAPPGREAQFAALLPPAVTVVAGGAERSRSVAAGLAALPPQVAVVLVHDAARALAPAGLFDRVRSAVLEGADAVVPGLPVVDTVKQVDEHGVVVATPPRERLRAVQTPQGFRRDALQAAHAAGADATDDAALVEQAGGRVLVVAGDPRAHKVTVADDLSALEQLVRRAAPGKAQ